MRNQKLKIPGQLYDEALLTTDRRYKLYEANDSDFNLEDSLLSRKTYSETGRVKKYQNFIPKQLVDDVLRSLHADFGKHPESPKR